MRAINHTLPVLAALATLSSCISYTTVRKVTAQNSDTVKGRRVYMPSVYLVFRPAKDGTVTYEKFILRDETKEYAVRSTTILGTHTENINYAPDSPGVLALFDSKHSSDEIAKQAIGTLAELAKTKITADIAGDKEAQKAVTAAESDVVAKTLARDKAQIDLDGATTDADKLAKETAFKKAEKDLEVSQATLQKALNAAADPSSGRHVAMTPLVYRLTNPSAGAPELKAVPYEVFLAASAKSAALSGSVLETQVTSPSSKKIAEATPPVEVFLGLTTDVVPRTDGKVSQKPVEITSDTELKSVKLMGVMVGDRSTTVVPSVWLGSKKSILVRFPANTPAGTYELDLSYVKYPKGEGSTEFPFLITVE